MTAKRSLNWDGSAPAQLSEFPELRVILTPGWLTQSVCGVSCTSRWQRDADEKSAQKHREMKPITVHSRKIINSPMIKLIFRDFPQTLIAIVNIFSSFLVSTRTFKMQLYFIKNSLYHNDVWAMSYVSFLL